MRELLAQGKDVACSEGTLIIYYARRHQWRIQGRMKGMHPLTIQFQQCFDE